MITTTRMNSSKTLKNIGKTWLISAAILLVLLVLGALFTSISLPEWMVTTAVIFSLSGLTWSVSLIYFYAEEQKRKNVIWWFSSSSVFFLCIGTIGKLNNWIGASLALMFAVFLFTGSALPLIIKNRYDKRKHIVGARTLVLNLLDLLAILLICFGLLGRLMHWQGHNELLFSGVILLVLAFISWNISFRKEVKLRVQAETQLKQTLKEVEEKNKEITDSINYAKRLQEAIFPSVDFISDQLPSNFVLYRPKDIIAGDFYWAEQIDDTFLLAVADCTGHGVPGALVSVVCCNALNRCIKEFHLKDPGEILDKTRLLVLESFSKKGEQIKDGMDISLLSICNGTFKWAGANNPLWQLRPNSSHSFDVTEIKANRQSIGYNEHPEAFVTHEVSIQKGDLLYLFTDGFADQFGGPKGKKFKYKPFQELLVSNAQLPLQEQKAVIETTFLTWKGELEQIDDLCVIGLRI